MTNRIKAVVGLGNPGPRYSETRHNAGFWFLDQLSRQFGGSLRDESKFHGEVGSVSIDGNKVWLLKPMTYMNCSGQGVRALASYYKFAPQELLVVYDELDLAPGVARFKLGGGHGGHNGLRDICSHLGSRDFARLRVGIGHPGDKDQVSDYVLSRARREDQAKIDLAIDEALRVAEQFIGGAIDAATKALHTATK